MFEENNTLVTEEVTENVEELTTEENQGEEVETVTDAPTETPKMYTEEELEVIKDIIKKNAKKSAERKYRKQFEKELESYKEVESVLNAGLGTSNIQEAKENLMEFYQRKGIEIPKYTPSYNDYDMKAGAELEANEIIESGFDEVVEEVDRLADKGVDNMTPREKLIFSKLADYRKAEGNRQELAKIGVKADVINSDDFKEFAKDFKTDVPITKIYEKYAKLQPKPEVEVMGSMKNATSNDTGVKDFYSRDEAMKFTKKDFDKNPALFKAVEQSMLKW